MTSRDMKTLRMIQLLKRRVLVTRGSARLMEAELARALSEGGGEVELDFSGIEGLTPSFLDETLSLIEEHARNIHERAFKVLIRNSPTHLSSKFEAVGRGHGLEIREIGEKTWIISKAGVHS